MIYIEYEPTPHAEDLRFLEHHLAQEAAEQKDMGPVEHFAFLAKEKSSLVGGVNGVMYYGCLYIDQLFLLPPYRNRGLGRELMLKAEELGKMRHCHFSTVCTMDWEAEPFYLKLGYQVEFRRCGYSHNSSMVFLRKDLV